MADGEPVIQVPGKHKAEFIAACKDPKALGLCVACDDQDGWELPTPEQVKYLSLFVQGLYAGFPSRNWIPTAGMRYGWNPEGVFIHESHHKRYFGIIRKCATLSLRQEAPEACPVFMGGVHTSGDSQTEKMLSKLMTHLPTISTELRHEVLRATFRRADSNGNGVLSRPEVGAMMRKVVNTMSAKETEDLMAQADANSNEEICYEEFVKWLQTSAPEQVTKRLQKAVGTEADVVKASFRVWDKNGDGLISRRELEKALSKMCKGFSEKQVKSLCDLMDVDDDGKVDYDEFVDFLFGTRRSQQ